MKAQIHISGVIGNIPDVALPAYTFATLTADVKEARAKGASELEFIIDSDGGLVDEGFLMASYIQTLPEKTTAVAVRVFSIANVIFFSCDERKGEDMSLFMLHQAWMSASGNSDELRKAADMLDKESLRIASYIATRTNLDLEAVKGLMATDRYIESEEADRLGFYSTQEALPIAALYNQESYSDYPESASNNAKRALKWLDENDNPNNCLTRVGFARANQLANKEPLSRDTIARMASFRRHQQYKDVPYEEGCGGVAWDAWGGESGIAWAEKKLNSIDNENRKNNMELTPEKEATSVLEKIKALVGISPKEEAPKNVEASTAEPAAMEEEEDEMAKIKEKMQAMEDENQALKAELAKYKEEKKAMEDEDDEKMKALEAKNSEMEEKLSAIVNHLKSVKSTATAINDLPTFSQPVNNTQKSEELKPKPTAHQQFIEQIRAQNRK